MSFSTSRENIKIETSLSTYYLIKEAKNFSDAKAAAEQDGGHLAVFETEEESRLLWDEINQNLSSYSSIFRVSESPVIYPI